MKTLTVYWKDGFEKFPDLYEYFTYSIERGQFLTVCERNIVTGEENEHAVFRNWEYLIIETSPDE